MTTPSTQQQFLETLEKYLQKLPKDEINEIITDYRGYFAEGEAAGRSEGDIIAALGDPSILAKELIAAQYIDTWQQQKSFKNLWYVLSVSLSMGLINLGLSLPVFIGMFISALLSMLFGALAIIGTVFTLAVLSHKVFGFPALDNYYINTHGVGPVLINTAKVTADTPTISIQNKDNKTFNMQREPDGGVSVNVRDGEETFNLQKNADGSIKKIRISSKKGEVVEISDIPKTSFAGNLLTGFGVILLGLIGFFACRKAMSALLVFWRKHFSWSKQTKARLM